MEGIAADVSQKLKSAIKAKLMELGADVDDKLPDYVMANRRSKAEMDRELQLFLGANTSAFTSWLQSMWMKLDRVLVTNSGDEDTFEKNPKGVCESLVSVNVNVGTPETNPARVRKELPEDRLRKLLIDSSVTLEELKEASFGLLCSFDELTGYINGMKRERQGQAQNYQENLDTLLTDHRIFCETQNETHLMEKNELVSQCASLKKDKENLTKITQMIFSHKVLKTFLNRILTKMDPHLEKEQNIKNVYSAWRKFFCGSEVHKDIAEAYADMSFAVSTNKDITLEVDLHQQSAETESVFNHYDWFSNHSTNLFFKLSKIVNKINKLDWAFNEDILKIVAEQVPQMTRSDIVVVSITHDGILPILRST